MQDDWCYLDIVAYNALMVFSLLHGFFYVAGSKPGSSPIFNLSLSTPGPVRKTGADDFLDSEIDKNDYEWYVVLLS